MAAVTTALLHLLARDRPPHLPLPTARFVAPGTARATRRARTPRDLLLLALRMTALVLAGAAFAGPLRHPEGGATARVVLLDAMPRGAALVAAVDSTRVRLREGDRLVIVDSVARPVPPGDEMRVLAALADAGEDSVRRDAGGSATLAAGLVAAVRAAATVDPSIDSVALHLVIAAEPADAAWREVRALWPGRAVVVRVPVATGDTTPPGIFVREGGRDAMRDPVVAGARVMGAQPVEGQIAGSRGALLVRGAASADDSAFARAGGMLLAWPADPARAGSGITPAPATDSVSGFVAGDAAVLFAAVRTHQPPAGRVVARWIDGAAAAAEVPLGAGCVRTAAIAVPAAGDLTLRAPFAGALAALMAPCGANAPTPLAAKTMRELAGAGPLASAGALRAGATRSPATSWLLGAALLLLLLEPLLRRAAPTQGNGASA